MIRALKFTVYRSGSAEVSGFRSDGSAAVKFETEERQRGEYFIVPAELAVRLIAEGQAERARSTGKLAALADAVLSAETPLAAALAGLAVSSVRSWHATQKGGYWFPVDAALGPGRGGFSARFRDKVEAEAVWAADPTAVPLFSFATPHGFDRAYIWRNRGLLEIPTEIHHAER